MKLAQSVLLCSLISSAFISYGQNSVGIGVASPNKNAVLELRSPGNNQGLLIPKLTTAQRTATAFVADLTNSESGLMVFDSDENKFYYWEANQWKAMGTGSGLVSGDGVTIVNNTISTIPQDLEFDGSVLKITNNPAAAEIDLSALSGGTSGPAGGDLDGSYPNPTVAINAITSAKILDATIAGADIADGTIASIDILDNTVATGDILDGTIVTADIATNGVETLDILDATIASIDIATGGVASIDILDNTIASGDILDATIAGVDIADGTIASIDILDNTVATGDILDGSIVTADIATNGVETLDILDATIASIDIATGGVQTVDILDQTILADDIADNAVVTNHILDGTIGTADIATGGVASVDILDNSIVSADIFDGTIASVDIADNSVASIDITDGSITGGDILDASVANAELALNSVNSTNIVDLSIVNADISNTAAINVSKFLGGANGQVLTTSGTTVGWANPSGTTLINNTGFANLFAGSPVGGGPGQENTFYGFNSGLDNTSGSGNVFMGSQSGENNTTGGLNVAIGWRAGFGAATATFNGNTFVGAEAGRVATSGPNTFIGEKSGVATNSGTENVFVGNRTGFLNTSGGQNTFLGYFSGDTNVGGQGITTVGYNADVATANLSNATAIGTGAIVDVSDKVRIGNAAVTVIQGQVGFTAASDRRLKTNIKPLTDGLDLVMKLKPVSYSMKNSADARSNWGFIAQDIESLVGNSNAVLTIGGDKERTLGLRYSDFVAPLVKAVQEQQDQIADLNNKLTESEKKYNELAAELEQIRKAVGLKASNK